MPISKVKISKLSSSSTIMAFPLEVGGLEESTIRESHITNWVETIIDVADGTIDVEIMVVGLEGTWVAHWQ